VSDTYIFGPTKLNTLDSSFIVMRTACSRSPGLRNSTARFGYRAPTGDPQSTIEKRYELLDNSAGRLEAEPQVWSGISLRTGFATFSLAPNGSFHFFSDAPLGAILADLLVQTQCSTPDCLLGDASSSVVGLYVQDDYKVTPSLTLNLGLRWDYFSTKTTITSMAGWEF